MFEFINAKKIYNKLYIENTSDEEKKIIYDKLVNNKNKKKIISGIVNWYLVNKVNFKIEYIEKEYVYYNKKSLISNIHSSSIPHKEKLLRFLS